MDGGHVEAPPLFAGSEYKLAQLQKYQLAIEPIALCYGSSSQSKVAHSIRHAIEIGAIGI
jgi:hypothetical protein